MIKGFVNKYVKATLNELFVDATKDSIQTSFGADLFSDSNINLKNLTFRPDIFDAYLHPLRLISGHLGVLTIEGIAELALGGKITIHVENVFLLFAVDTVIDPEYIQYLKKVLIEMQTANIQHVIYRELLKRVQGFSGSKDPDFKKQRLLMIQMIQYLFKSFQVLIKGIHIRIETPTFASSVSTNGQSSTSAPSNSINPNYCSALGCTIPLIRVSQNASIRPDNVNKDEPVLSLLIKNLQVYCDYNCETYTSNGMTSAKILQQFLARWKHEIHTAMLMPFDIEIAVAAEIKRRTGLVLPKIVINIPNLRLACDYKQLEVIKKIYEQYVLSKKRCEHLITLRATYGKEGPPRLVLTGGSHVLPTLYPGYYKYPVPPPSAEGTPVTRDSRIVELLKARVGVRWKKALWKHLIRVVLHDVRMARPMGRWFMLVRLAHMRKEYSFIYSKLLKRSAKSGNFIYNVNARVDMITVKKLFDYEMFLPVSSVIQFRTLAMMIATVEMFNGKRQQARQVSKGYNNVQPYERIGITWPDVVLIHAVLSEAQNDSAFRRRPKSSIDELDSPDIDDDSASVYSAAPSRKSDETASVFGYRNSINMGTTRINSGMMSVAGASSVLSSTASTAAKFMPSFMTSSSSSHGNSTHGNTAAAYNPNSPDRGTSTRTSLVSQSNQPLVSMQMQMSKVMGIGGNNNQVDDYDSKLFGRKEMSAFGDFLGTQENEERHNEEEASRNPPIEMRMYIFDWKLEGESPPFHIINECVHYILIRHQKPLTLFPPDISLQVPSIDFHFRKPLENGTRETLGVLSVRNLMTSITITESNTEPIPNSSASMSSTSLQQQQLLDKKGYLHLGAKSIKGFASIAGSLIQLRTTVQSVTCQIYVQNKEILSALNGTKVVTLEALSKQYDQEMQSKKATAATAGGGGGMNDKKSQVDSLARSTDLDMNDDEEDAGDGDDNNYTIPGYENIKIDSAVTPTATTTGLNPADISKKDSPDGPLIAELLSSSSKENLVTLCLMLDFDDKCQGAADLQVQVGTVKLTLSSELVTYILDDSTKLNFTRVIKILDDMTYMGRVRQEAALYIDPDTKLPYVESFLFDIMPHMSSKPTVSAISNNEKVAVAEAGEEHVDVTVTSEQHMTSSLSDEYLTSYKHKLKNVLTSKSDLNELEETSSPNTNTADKQQQQSTSADTSSTLSYEEKLRYRQEVKAKRLVRREHINFHHWRSTLTQYTPHLFSVCIRTSAITIDSLTTVTIERMLYSEIEKLADRACLHESRRQENSLAAGKTYFGLHLIQKSYASLLLQSINDLRNDSSSGFNARHSLSAQRSNTITSTSGGNTNVSTSNTQNLHLDLPSLEIVIVKKTNPSEIFVRLFGMEMKIPVSQEVLYDLAALGLKRHMPCYK